MEAKIDKMKRILVPTDFSPTSEKAFRIALEMALKSNGKIILYHAYTAVERTSSVALDKRSADSNKQTENDLGKRLERFKKKVMANGMDVPVSIALGHNPIIKNMLGFAKDNHIDLIVMGTQGASGLRKAMPRRMQVQRRS